MKVSIDGGLTWHDSTHVQLIYKLDKNEPDYQYIVKYTDKQYTEILENGQDVAAPNGCGKPSSQV